MFLIPYRIPDWKENKDICIHQPFYVSMGKSTLLSLFNLILCNSPWDSFHATKYNLFLSLIHTHTQAILVQGVYVCVSFISSCLTGGPYVVLWGGAVPHQPVPWLPPAAGGVWILFGRGHTTVCWTYWILGR